MPTGPPSANANTRTAPRHPPPILGSLLLKSSSFHPLTPSLKHFAHPAIKRLRCQGRGATPLGAPAGQRPPTVHLPLAFSTTAGAGPNPCTSAIQEPGQLLDTLTSLKAQALRSKGAWRALEHTPFPKTLGWKTFPNTPRSIYQALFTLIMTTPLHPLPTMFLTDPTTVPSRIWEFGTRGGVMLRT